MKSIKEMGDQRMIDRLLGGIQFKILLRRIGHVGRPINQDVIPRLGAVGLRLIFHIPLFAGRAVLIHINNHCPISIPLVTNQLSWFE